MLKKFNIVLILFLSFSSVLFSFNSSNSDLMIYPTTITYTSSEFGYRELFNMTFHDGIDFPVPKGTPVYATLSGIVKFCDFTKTGYGNAVILLHNDGTKSLYGHLSENFVVSLGQNVYQGQIIGYVGPKYLSNGKLNGNTTGPHLHFSIFNTNGKAIDPFSFEYKKRE